MLERVVKLESAVGPLQRDVTEVRGDTRSMRDSLIRIEAKLDGKADASTVTPLAAKLDDKPGTWKVVTIILLIGGLLIVGRPTPERAVGSLLPPKPAAMVAG